MHFSVLQIARRFGLSDFKRNHHKIKLEITSQITLSVNFNNDAIKRLKALKELIAKSITSAKVSIWIDKCICKFACKYY